MLAYPDPPLTDDGLQLWPWAVRDLPVLERASADDYIVAITGLPFPFSAPAARDWIAAQRALVQGDRGWSFVVVDRERGEAVGGIEMVLGYSPGIAEPTVWVVAERRNRGVAQRAIRLLCTWALTSDTGIERIKATVEPWNGASRRLLEKIGFTRDGLVSGYRYWGGPRQNALIYSLRASDLPPGAAP